MMRKNIWLKQLNAYFAHNADNSYCFFVIFIMGCSIYLFQPKALTYKKITQYNMCTYTSVQAAIILF